MSATGIALFVGVLGNELGMLLMGAVLAYVIFTQMFPSKAALEAAAREQKRYSEAAERMKALYKQV